jgi:hypothetical protein
MGITGALVGLIVGVIYGGVLLMLGIVGAAAGGQQADAAGFAAFGIVGGIMAIVLIPLFYGVVSFIVGLIYGLIINFALRIAGGLELEIR